MEYFEEGETSLEGSPMLDKYPESSDKNQLVYDTIRDTRSDTVFKISRRPPGIFFKRSFKTPDVFKSG
jgi:hypothetical protein